MPRLAEAAVIAVLLAGTAWLGSTMHHNYVAHPDNGAVQVRVAPAELPVLPEPDGATTVRLGEGRGDLLFVLSTTCPFCEQNMAEWRRLADRVAELREGRPSVAVLSVSSPEETRRFLIEHELDLPVRYVDSAVLPLLGLSGYPSTVAIDPRTRSLAIWAGVLGEPEHRALEAWSRSATPSASQVAGAGGLPSP